MPVSRLRNRYQVPNRCEPRLCDSEPIEEKPWFCTRTTISLIPSETAVTISGRHHQVGAVADHREDLAIGRGHLDPERAGDLVAHAGVAVLDVVLLGVPGTPQHLQVPGQAAGGLDDDVAGRPSPRSARRSPRSAPAAAGGRGGRPRSTTASQRGPVLGEGLRCRRRRPGSPASAAVSASRPCRASATRLTAACLAASKRGDVEVDEPHVRVLEGGPGRGGEVAVAGADADHDVGLAGQRVGDRRAGGPDAADRARVVPEDRALAGLGVGDRDAGGLGERRAAPRSASE